MRPLHVGRFAVLRDGCFDEVPVAALHADVEAILPERGRVSLERDGDGLLRVVEHVDVVREPGRTDEMVERETAGDVGDAALYPRTGNPLEYSGLKSGGSHFRISHTRL